jgi:hypothetical protein
MLPKGAAVDVVVQFLSGWSFWFDVVLVIGGFGSFLERNCAIFALNKNLVLVLCQYFYL